MDEKEKELAATNKLLNIIRGEKGADEPQGLPLQTSQIDEKGGGPEKQIIQHSNQAPEIPDVNSKTLNSPFASSKNPLP